MDQWTNGPMVQWTNGPMDQCYNGPMLQWTNAPMDQWTNGQLGQRYPQDIPNISPRYPQDIPKISPRYHQDITKIPPRSGLVWSGLVWSLLKGLEQFETLKPKCWTGLDWTGSLNHLTIRAPQGGANNHIEDILEPFQLGGVYITNFECR